MLFKQKNILWVILILSALSLQAWEPLRKNIGRVKVEFKGGFFFKKASGGSATFYFQSDKRVELGWTVKYFNLNDTGQFLEGSYFSFGPVWRYTRLFNKSGFGFILNLSVLYTAQSELTTTEQKDDVSKFDFESIFGFSIFHKLRLGNKVFLFPSLGVINYLSFFSKTGVEDAYKRGLFEAGIKVSLPLKIIKSAKKVIIIEPSYIFDLYASKFKKMIPLSIMVGLTF